MIEVVMLSLFLFLDQFIIVNADPFGFLAFAVSRAILIARAPSPADVAGHPLVKVSF